MFPADNKPQMEVKEHFVMIIGNPDQYQSREQQIMRGKPYFKTGFVLLTLFWVTAAIPASAKQPNMVFILADDMGYGDVHALNSNSQIATPNLDRLAASGMTFLDAHTPSAVCTPTRYGLLTGRYCWRSRLKRGVLNGYGTPLIEP